jgi:glycosyltransferase involved in cell wall biosynthesis
MGDYFILLGRKKWSELINHYLQCHAFVLPSYDEGFPLTLLEAWSARLPVIVTNVGIISRICKDKENALIVSPRDIKELEQSMLSLIKYPLLREKLSKNGRKTVEKEYAWDNISKDLEVVYREVIK